MKRRSILLVSGGLVIALPAAHLAARHWPASVPPIETAGDLVSWFAGPADIQEIGEAYMAQAADAESDLPMLIDQLPAFFDTNGAILTDLSADTIQRRYSDRVAADFESGETAVVNGWVLARTEARVCALVVLTSA